MEASTTTRTKARGKKTSMAAREVRKIDERYGRAKQAQEVSLACCAQPQSQRFVSFKGEGLPRSFRATKEQHHDCWYSFGSKTDDHGPSSANVLRHSGRRFEMEGLARDCESRSGSKCVFPGPQKHFLHVVLSFCLYLSKMSG